MNGSTVLESHFKVFPLPYRDAAILLSLIRQKLVELQLYCEKMGLDPMEAPYFVHLSAIAADIQSFL